MNKLKTNVDDIINSLDPDKFQCAKCGKWLISNMLHYFRYKWYCGSCHYIEFRKYRIK